MLTTELFFLISGCDLGVSVYSDRIRVNRLLAFDKEILFQNVIGFCHDIKTDSVTVEYRFYSKSERITFPVSFGKRSRLLFLDWLRAHFTDLGNSASS